jgi:hypothetical protein
VDLFAYDARAKKFILLEVRGIAKGGIPPSQMLAPGKLRRLFWLARSLQRERLGEVRIEFLEVRGTLPRFAVGIRLLLGWWPELFGLRLRAFTVDEADASTCCRW